jgi:catechol 2,3-dioxygenase-like lactoylglutathione lyase family enzyme
MIKKLHHNAYRCRDSEETRRFYEDFLGLRLALALDIGPGRVMHTFFALGDGSFLAFFEAPQRPFEFKTQNDIDLHIALEVEPAELEAWLEKGCKAGVPTQGIDDHEAVRSVYFRDPNGYLIELAARTPAHDAMTDPSINGARASLDRWQATKKTTLGVEPLPSPA